MLNSQLFDLNNISEVNNIETNSAINIKLKADITSINKLFANLYEYAKDPLFIKIINRVELEHNKYANKYANIKTYKHNKNFKLRMRKLLTYKNKPNNVQNMRDYMLTNLKMMIYDYNI
jgi:hypothetical protein